MGKAQKAIGPIERMEAIGLRQDLTGFALPILRIIAWLMRTSGLYPWKLGPRQKLREGGKFNLKNSGH